MSILDFWDPNLSILVSQCRNFSKFWTVKIKICRFWIFEIQICRFWFPNVEIFRNFEVLSSKLVYFGCLSCKLPRFTQFVQQGLNYPNKTQKNSNYPRVGNHWLNELLHRIVSCWFFLTNVFDVEYEGVDRRDRSQRVPFGADQLECRNHERAAAGTQQSRYLSQGKGYRILSSSSHPRNCNSNLNYKKKKNYKKI